MLPKVTNWRRAFLLAPLVLAVTYHVVARGLVAYWNWREAPRALESVDSAWYYFKVLGFLRIVLLLCLIWVSVRATIFEWNKGVRNRIIVWWVYSALIWVFSSLFLDITGREFSRFM